VPAPPNPLPAVPAPYLPSTEEPTLSEITPPSRYCAKHQPYGTDDKCHACGRARRYRDEIWPTTNEGSGYHHEVEIRKAGTKIGAKGAARDRQLIGGVSAAERITRTLGTSIPKSVLSERVREIDNAEVIELPPNGTDRKALEWLELGRRQLDPEPPRDEIS
jgi:hypothetical protein